MLFAMAFAQFPITRCWKEFREFLLERTLAGSSFHSYLTPTKRGRRRSFSRFHRTFHWWIRLRSATEHRYRFALEGRDVYSRAAPFLLLSSGGAQPPLPASPIVPQPSFAPNGARSFGCVRSYKHLAPLERKQRSCFLSENESSVAPSNLNSRSVNEK